MKARSFEETFIRPGQTTFVRPLGDNKVVHSQTTTQDGNQTVVIDGAHRLPKLAK